MNKPAHFVFFLLGVCLVGLLAACTRVTAPTIDRWPTMTAFVATNQAYWNRGGGASHTPAAVAEVLPTGTLALDAENTPLPMAKATATPLPPSQYTSLALPASLPLALRQAIALPEGVSLHSAAPADLTLTLNAAPALSQWVYALVAPFPTLTDDVPFDNLRRAWLGETSLPGQPLLMDAETLALFTAHWGAPAAGVVETLPTDQLLDTAWSRRTTWAIIPFERLQPRWKVLSLDGQSPIHKNFDRQTYPLTVSFGVIDAQGNPVMQLPEGWLLPETNRDPNRMTVAVLTGVTALVRGTSNTMYAKGITYPAQEIGPWLREADITHISNEITFTDDCLKYDTSIVELKFCTNAEYIGLLEAVDANVIELTGDHFIDQSADAMRYTLDLYHQRGWLTYGGGATLAEGLKAVTLAHNGNQFAFIGCNAKGGGYALASETNPGAAECDFDQQYAEVRRLSQEGYIVIATMQHEEIYRHTVSPEVRPDFVGFANAGAAIVQGSQAHMPQNFEFVGNSLIHYGLGNLFFDQIYELDFNNQPMADKAFIDRHIFYAGRHISTELLTIQFVDYALSRPMTSAEREAFLRVIFTASGW
jgi:poly-gamma-glutamate synthesis protein (capsule biosynthesis protein)